MLIFQCHICATTLSAQPTQVGELVRCPQCLTTLRVPVAKPASENAAEPAVGGAAARGPESLEIDVSQQSSAHGSPVREPSINVSAGGTSIAAPPPRRTAAPSQFRGGGGGKRYGFNCAYCSSRLEASESMAAQDGQCPTCGNNITIPILDRYGRLIDPVTKQIIKQDPHPVHAYAAAGDRAPKILRQATGTQTIQCPRCKSISAITANNCKSCGMPFTMEGTTLEASGTSNGFCVASLVLGIIGLPTGCIIVTPVLAIIFGIIGYRQVSAGGGEGGGRGMAIAGMICGGLGLIVAWMVYMR